jgi:hypothetical protein
MEQEKFQTLVLNGMQELTEAMQEFSSRTDERFDRLEKDVGDLKKDVVSVKATMVTKDYLDIKLADEGVRYGGLVRETNEKTHALVDALVTENVIIPQIGTDITSRSPFARK